MGTRLLITGFVLAAAAATGCAQLSLGPASDVPSPFERALREEVAAAKRPGYVTADAEGTRLWKLTREFYERRDFALAWIHNGAPRSQIDALIRALKAAEDEGLDPEMYGVSALEAHYREASRGFLTKKGFEPEDAGRIDAWLTYLHMKYASDLADGISDLVHADSSWKIEPATFDPLEHLERALAGNRIVESFEELTPRTPQYRQLREALTDYRRRAEAGGWPEVPGTLRAKPGQQGTEVAVLARRLAASGDYDGRIPAEGPMEYDERLQDAAKKFQRRHGLADDGIVGPAVVRQLNVPIETRITQLELNLERWRWLPRELGDRHVLVNIPAFHLEVWEKGRVALAMRVVVGTREHQTPIFNDTMTYLVFSPYWHVPPGIAESETLPAVLTDASFLDRNNMEVLDRSGKLVDPRTIDLDDPAGYRFRQRPGRGNSLGLVKFMFPNQFNVYLHDTPAHSLFGRATRSYSHGCVRVEQPEALAEYLLRDQDGWDKPKIEKAMHAGEETTVKLRQPVPVYLGYWTAAVTPDGVQFTDDVYGIDGRQTRLVAERRARLQKTKPAVDRKAVAEP